MQQASRAVLMIGNVYIQQQLIQMKEYEDKTINTNPTSFNTSTTTEYLLETNTNTIGYVLPEDPNKN